MAISRWKPPVNLKPYWARPLPTFLICGVWISLSIIDLKKVEILSVWPDLVLLSTSVHCSRCCVASHITFSDSLQIPISYYKFTIAQATTPPCSSNSKARVYEQPQALEMPTLPYTPQVVPDSSKSSQPALPVSSLDWAIACLALATGSQLQHHLFAVEMGASGGFGREILIWELPAYRWHLSPKLHAFSFCGLI